MGGEKGGFNVLGTDNDHRLPNLDASSDEGTTIVEPGRVAAGEMSPAVKADHDGKTGSLHSWCRNGDIEVQALKFVKSIRLLGVDFTKLLGSKSI